MSPNSNTTVPRRTLPNEIRYADYPSTHSVMDFTGVYVLYLVLTVGLSETYAPSLLPPIVLLAFLDDPLPLSLKLIRSLRTLMVPAST